MSERITASEVKVGEVVWLPSGDPLFVAHVQTFGDLKVSVNGYRPNGMYTHTKLWVNERVVRIARNPPPASGGRPFRLFEDEREWLTPTEARILARGFVSYIDADANPNAKRSLHRVIITRSYSREGIAVWAWNDGHAIEIAAALAKRRWPDIFVRRENDYSKFNRTKSGDVRWDALYAMEEWPALEGYAHRGQRAVVVPR